MLLRSSTSTIVTNMIVLGYVLLIHLLVVQTNGKSLSASPLSSSSSILKEESNRLKLKVVWSEIENRKKIEIVKAIKLLESNGILQMICSRDHESPSSSPSSSAQYHHDTINSLLHTTYEEVEMNHTGISTEGRSTVATTNNAALLNNELEESVLSSSEDEGVDSRDAHLVAIDLMCAFCCILVSSMAAAFTIGVLSIDPFELLVIIRTAESESERKRAEGLMPIVEKRHQLMVTLLILNALSNEALPIFIERLVPAAVAILLSVISVLIFGDILPTAIFSGPNKIELASYFVPLMNLLMCLLTPIAWPIAKLLDWCLGHRDPSYDRNELAALVRINYEERRRLIEDETTSSSTDNCSLTLTLTGDDEKRERLLRTCSSSRSRDIGLGEVTMIEGVLNLKSKKTAHLLTPLPGAFLLPDDVILNKEEILKIYLSGYSRIPIYTNSNASLTATSTSIVDKTPKDFKENITSIRGILLTKQLMVIESSDNKRLSTMPLQQPICVHPSMNLIQLIHTFLTESKTLHAFKQGGHLAIVCNYPLKATNAMDQGLPIPNDAEVLGIVTLEDVFEQLIQEEILDEKDFREQHVISHCRLLGHSFSSR